jgi:hypothetical protein
VVLSSQQEQAAVVLPFQQEQAVVGVGRMSLLRSSSYSSSQVLPRLQVPVAEVVELLVAVLVLVAAAKMMPPQSSCFFFSASLALLRQQVQMEKVLVVLLVVRPHLSFYSAVSLAFLQVKAGLRQVRLVVEAAQRLSLTRISFCRLLVLAVVQSAPLPHSSYAESWLMRLVLALVRLPPPSAFLSSVSFLFSSLQVAAASAAASAAMMRWMMLGGVGSQSLGEHTRQPVPS